jgi:hypothetical protein
VTDSKFKTAENRARRQLERMGYRLVKNRVRDPRAYNHGGYMIACLWTNAIVCGSGGTDFNMDFDQVQDFIETAEPNKR